MTIQKWNPFLEMSNFRREFDRLFNSFLGQDLRDWRSSEIDSWQPAVDVEETEDNFVVKTELPGVQESEVQLAINGDNLVIKGEKKLFREEKSKMYHHSERLYGSFKRVVALPSSVDPEKTSAAYKDGVLTITLPKKEKSISRTIPIKMA